jgi:biopolymer transport protein ExbD
MAFRSFNAGSGMAPMSEINTTPLVDVMLVLLVIFIITAPLFHQAVPIDLPKVDSTRLDEQAKPIQLAVTEAGRVFVDGLEVGMANLEGVLRGRAKASSIAPEVHLRADRGTRYERVAEVMATSHRAGLTRIAFVTLPPI